eukprot:SAG11_NODE_1749_length_4320_cov_15.669983_3_plen_188_part_00
MDKWSLDLSHVGSKALLLEHIKKVKAGELRNLETWTSLPHDGLLGERRKTFADFIEASFLHAQLAYCCYFWDDMVSEVKDLGITMDSACLDAGQPKAEHPDANILHGLCQDVGLDPRDSLSRDYFDAIPRHSGDVCRPSRGWIHALQAQTHQCDRPCDNASRISVWPACCLCTERWRCERPAPSAKF